MRTNNVAGGAGALGGVGLPQTPGARPGSRPTASASGERPVGNASPAPSSASLPSISLPSGGGAIRGVDEKFAVNQTTGTASLAVPVFTSPARQGFGPKLSLNYDSGAGNGPFGLGWSVGVPVITRKTSKGLPRYDDAADSDVFIFAGAEELVPLLVLSGSDWSRDERQVTLGPSTYDVRRYRPRVEAGFARIERWRQAVTGDVHWRTVSRDNVTSLYGLDPTSTIADPDDPSRVFSWFLALTYDDRGNAVSYVYKAEDASEVPTAAAEAHREVGANRYLKRVRYGNVEPYVSPADDVASIPDEWFFELVLDYGEHDLANPTPSEDVHWPCRSDPFSTYRSCFEIRTYRTCRRLLMFHDIAELGDQPVLVRSTDLTYEADNASHDPTLPGLTMLASVTQTGWLAAPGGGYETAQLPPLVLGYSPLNVDGRVSVADAATVDNVTGSFDGSTERWIDLEGVGLPGVLTADDAAWYYKRNVSAFDPGGGPPSVRLEPLVLVADKPVAAAQAGALMLTDLNGDGNLCAVTLTPPSPGWFEYDADEGWGPFQTFDRTASVDWTSADLRLVDVDGDGLADVLITEDDAFTWYGWDVGGGFEPAGRVARVFDEERGPTVVFADTTDSISLADMSGDGLADIVRIRSGEVSYWPNLGYGRFGAKVTMDFSPAFDTPDQFDARRVRLADVNGTGTADLLYLGAQATLWFNQCGNSWTDAHQLPAFPQVDLDVQATVFDLLGTGTACLVWTSALPGDVAAPLRYIDLTGSSKPYLLTTVANSLGAQRTLTYSPSTRFYLEDRANGTPWLTRLPFPVHVVDRVQTDEAISGTRFVAQYSYHHGFFDGIEREFRGFARVDLLDTDSLPAASGIGGFTSTPLVTDDRFELPPVLSKTWYHTGAFVDRDDLSARLAEEYWSGDAQRPLLGKAILPAGTTAEALREACRALRGRVLREEIYALDGTANAANPYVTTEHRHEVDLLQPPSDSSYGVFFGWQRESLSCHYEREPADPRLFHELSLAVDEFGHVTRHASVSYPRRTPAYPAQGATLVRYSETDIVNAADQDAWYRLGLTTETRSFELTGVAPTVAGGLFDPDALATGAPAAAEIAYHEVPTGATPQRRLLSRSRTIYQSDDLAPLPLGQVDSLALTYKTYALCATTALLGAVLGAKFGSTEVAALLDPAKGALTDLDGDGGFWVPSPRLLYSADPAHPDAGYARSHFYLPQGSVDSWGNASTVTYDSHDLLLSQTTDAAGNTASAESNYRVLGPWLAVDANGNRSGIRFDALGMVVDTALMGKQLGDGTFEGDHLDLTTAEASPADDPTTTMTYDLSAYANWLADPGHDPDHPVPVSALTRARVRHHDPASPWIESYAYTDGFGRVALSKAQAEAGPAPQRDSSGKLVRDGKGALVIVPTSSRWVGTGRTVYDNKGNPVKAYEPFFDSSPAYDDDADLLEWGVTSITQYDPLGRPIRIDNPNGSYRTVQIGPWQTVSSDENDTVLTSGWYSARSGGLLGVDEADAATKAAAHAGTPSTIDLDTLGRTFRSVSDNGAADRYATTFELDLDGLVLTTTDPLGRIALTQDYDMAGTELHHTSIDSGERWLLVDAGRQLLESWDSRGFHIQGSYDSLRRPTDST